MHAQIDKSNEQGGKVTILNNTLQQGISEDYNTDSIKNKLLFGDELGYNSLETILLCFF